MRSSEWAYDTAELATAPVRSHDVAEILGTAQAAAYGYRHMSQINVNDPFQLIGYAATTMPGSVAVIPVYHPNSPSDLVQRVSIKTRAIPPDMRFKGGLVDDATGLPIVGGRGNNGSSHRVLDQPTHVETARMVSIIPSDVARNIKGGDGDRDIMYLVLVRRGAYDRAASGIVVPGIVGSVS